MNDKANDEKSNNKNGKDDNKSGNIMILLRCLMKKYSSCFYLLILRILKVNLFN